MNIDKLHITIPALETGKLTDIDSKTDDDAKLKICKNRKYVKCGILPYRFIFGLGLTIWGVIITIFTPFEIMMNERLKMVPGLPPFDWWETPPDEVLCRVYIFNITNSAEFLNGTDGKLRIEEVGPIVYREKLTHTNITFNDNGTLTYVATRKLIYLPDMNHVNLNDTIVVPNLGVLLVPSFFYDASFFTKFGINLMLRRLNSQTLVNTTIYNYLWNFSDPILDVAQQVAPFMVPTKNMGVLDMLYSKFVDTVTVYIGTENGNEKYFGIDKFDGSEYLPGFGSGCVEKVQNSTEGVCYPQQLTENSTLKYWRKSICRVMKLHYESQFQMHGMDVNKYLLAKNSYDRNFPETEDCYRGKPVLPNGLADISPCYFNAPIAISFPHFLYGDDEIHNYIDGFTPNVEDHQSYVILEPTTGVPVEGKARSQSNLIMKDMKGFNDKIQRFSNTVIPLSWIEYHQEGIPWYVKALLYLTVRITPPGQKVASAVLIILGVFFMCQDFRKRRKQVQRIKMKLETRPFLKI